VIISGVVLPLALGLILEAQEAKREFAHGARVILALVVVIAKVETAGTGSFARNLDVVVVVEGQEAEREHGLVDTLFATGIFLILHLGGIPVAITKETKLAKAFEAGLTRIHGFVVQKSAALEAPLTINVLQKLFLILESLKGRDIGRCLEDVLGLDGFGAYDARDLEPLLQKPSLIVLWTDPDTAGLEAADVVFKADRTIRRAPGHLLQLVGQLLLCDCLERGREREPSQQAAEHKDVAILGDISLLSIKLLLVVHGQRLATDDISKAQSLFAIAKPKSFLHALNKFVHRQFFGELGDNRFPVEISDENLHLHRVWCE